MSDIETIDISKIKFTSTVFPTAEDQALWDSLTPDEQRAVVLRDLEEAEKSGIAPRQTMTEIIAEARAEIKHEL